jgi:hypothetical protein
MPFISARPLANEAASVVYNRHHMNCIQCIGGGRGIRYGQRCKVGLELWSLYQSTSADAPEGAPLAGKASGAVALEIVPPVGNTGGTLTRSLNHG